MKRLWIACAILALLLGLLLSNLGVLPVHSGLYDDVIWGFAVPLSIPMLLQQCSLQRVRRTGAKPGRSRKRFFPPGKTISFISMPP